MPVMPVRPARSQQHEVAKTPMVQQAAPALSSSRHGRSHARIVGVVALYFAVSISMVFVNKMLVSSGASVPAPLFVTWFQCVVTVVICAALGKLTAAGYCPILRSLCATSLSVPGHEHKLPPCFCALYSEIHIC